MLRLPFLLILLLSICACGQKGQVTETKFVISGLVAAAPIDFVTSSALVTAYNPNTQLIVRLQLNSNSQSVTLPNGTWYFSVVQWNSLNTEAAAQVRCGITKEELTGESLNLNITLTMAACLTPDFNAPQFTNAGNFQALKLNQCSSFGAPSADCSLTPGFIRGVRIAFHNIQLSPVDTPAVAPNTIVSPCIAIGAGTGIIDLFTKLPSGSNVAPIPFTIRAFSDTACGTQTRFFRFHRGLMSGDQGDMRVFDDTTSNTTRVMVRDGGIAPILPTLLLPAESSYQFNLNNFFFGGTTPYTFSHDGSCGSISGSIFIPNNASNASCFITATDNNGTGNLATLIFTTVVAAHHTIFNDPATVGTKWTVSRATGNYSMQAPGVLTELPSNTPRFIQTAALSTPVTIDADAFLINEKGSQNLLTSPVTLTDAAWTKPSGINLGSPSTTIISNSSSHYPLAKTIAGSLSLYQDLPPRTGNHVASVYLKKGSSRFAGLKLADASNTCTGLVVDLETGSTLAMDGCPLLGTGIGLHGALYIGNGWWRVWVTRTFVSGMSGTFRIYPAWNSSLTPFENTSLTGEIFVFNPQLEGGDRPTTVMSNSTTRGNEFAAMVNPTDVNLSTGTFLLDWHSREPEPNKILMSFCSGTSDAVNITLNNGYPQVRNFFNPGIMLATTLHDITANLESRNRIAFKIDASNTKLFKRNDSIPISGSGIGSAINPSAVYIGRGCSGSWVPHNVGVRRFGYWAVPFEDVVLREMSNGSN